MIIITTKEKTVFANEEHVKFLFHDKENGIVTINSHNGAVMVENVVEVRYLDRPNTDYLDKGNALLKAEETVEYVRRKLDWFRRRENFYRDMVKSYTHALRSVVSFSSEQEHDAEKLIATIVKTVKDTFMNVDSITGVYNQEERERMEREGESYIFERRPLI